MWSTLAGRVMTVLLSSDSLVFCTFSWAVSALLAKVIKANKKIPNTLDEDLKESSHSLLNLGLENTSIFLQNYMRDTPWSHQVFVMPLIQWTAPFIKSPWATFSHLQIPPLWHWKNLFSFKSFFSLQLFYSYTMVFYENSMQLSVLHFIRPYDIFTITSVFTSRISSVYWLPQLL